jgi:hypothetical protein
MRYQNKHEEWTKIREALKEKYNAPVTTQNLPVNDGSKPAADVYWSHMTRITGRSKEDLLKKLRNL